MPFHSHALVAVSAPLISLAAALPQHYVSRSITNDAGLPKEVNVNLASLQETGENKLKNVTTSSPETAAADAGQCATHGDFTYYAERPLPGGELEPILIEECDPSNPNQVRLAYVDNKDVHGKLSPTSILIGCTNPSLKSFAARQNGAFNKIAPGVYTNFVKRAVPTGMRTTLAAKKPMALKKVAPNKRSELEAKDILVKRWESRSDVDQYSDGYHTCRSASSSACRLLMTKRVCPDLEKALKAALPAVKPEDATLNKRFACDPKGLKGVKCPAVPIGGPFQLPPSLERGQGNPLDKRAHVEEGNAVPLRAMTSAKTKEHNEFMRRWLQGDEHPRSFMARSQQVDGEALPQKRSMGLEDAHQYHQYARADLHRIDNDWHGARQYDDGGDDLLSPRSHHYHGEDHDTCTDFSQRNDPRCQMKNRYAGLQQKRDLVQKRDVDTPVDEVQMAARYDRYDDVSECTDLSDANRVQCQLARARETRFTKRGEQVALEKRSDGNADRAVAGAMEKRWSGDRHSVDGYGSRKSRSSKGIYHKREVGNTTDRSIVMRSAEEGSLEELLNKRSQYSLDSGRSYSSRGRYRYRQRAVDDAADQAMVKRSIDEAAGEADLMDKRSHHGRGYRGRSRSSHRRRALESEDGPDMLEKRSHHGSRGRSRSRSWHRRDVQPAGDGDVLEKRSHHGNGRRRSHSRDYHKRALETGNDATVEKRSDHSGRWGNRHYRSYSHSNGRSNSRSRREVKVEVDVLGKRDVLDARQLIDLYDDDGMTVRSALSEHGDIFERGQDSYTNLLGKRGLGSNQGALSKRLVVGREADVQPSKRDCEYSDRWWRIDLGKADSIPQWPHRFGR